MLCHFDGTFVDDVNNNITYNGDNSLLLNGNLGMLYVEMKETICHGLGWSYNDINIKITWRCQIGEYQYDHVPIVCDDSFKTIINFFIQSGLNIMVLYVSSLPKSLCVPTSNQICINALQYVGPLKSVSRGKNNLFSNDLL